MRIQVLVPLSTILVASFAFGQDVPPKPTELPPPPAGVSPWLLNEKYLQAKPAPSTTDDKLRRYLHQTFTPGAYINTALAGAFTQLNDSSDDWGHGGGAYASHIGSKVGARMVRNSIRFGLDVAMGVDSHYRRSDADGFWSRLGHAVSSTVIAQRDGGGKAFGAPQVISSYGSAFASNLWYPQLRNSPQDALIRGTTGLGWTAAKNVLKEFWPDIKHALNLR